MHWAMGHRDGETDVRREAAPNWDSPRTIVFAEEVEEVPVGTEMRRNCEMCSMNLQQLQTSGMVEVEAALCWRCRASCWVDSGSDLEFRKTCSCLNRAPS